MDLVGHALQEGEQGHDPEPGPAGTDIPIVFAGQHGAGDIQVDPRCVTLEALKEERRSDGASPWSAEVCYIGTLAL